MPTKSRLGYVRDLGKRKPTDDDFEYVLELKSLLKDAKEVRRQTREDDWVDAEKRYMGKHPIMNPDDPTADAIVVNKTFSTIETVTPFVTGGTIEFVVHPQSHDSTSQNARYQSIWMNRVWRSNDFDGEKQKEHAAWDSVVYGDGYLMASHSIEEVVERGPQGDPIPTSGREVAYFHLEPVSPWDIWLDRYSSGLQDARWYMRRIVLPRTVAEDSENLHYIDEVESDMFEEGYDSEGSFFQHKMKEGDREMVTLYEYWDRDRNLRVVFCETCEFPHQWVEHVDRNIVQLENHRIPGLPYHMSDVEQMSQLQDELNKTRSQMITMRKRNTLKYIVDKTAFDDDAINALQSSAIGLAIAADTQSQEIGQIFQAVNPVPINEDVYNVAQVISADIDEITGVNEYLRGNLSEIRRTATEASIIEGSSNTKIAAKIAKIERAVRQVGQILLELAAEVIPLTDTRELEMYLTGEEAQQVLAASGSDIFDEAGNPRDAIMSPGPELFKGKYEVFVRAGSTELRNSQADAEKMKDVFMTLAQMQPVLQQSGVIVSLRHALVEWLEAMGITDISSYLNDPAAMGAYESQLMMQQQGMQGGGMGGPGGPGGPPGGGVAGAGPEGQMGEPNMAAAQPPEAMIDEGNSGIMPPAQY